SPAAPQIGLRGVSHGFHQGYPIGPRIWYKGLSWTHPAVWSVVDPQELLLRYYSRVRAYGWCCSKCTGPLIENSAGIRFTRRQWRSSTKWAWRTISSNSRMPKRRRFHWSLPRDVLWWLNLPG